MDLAHIHLMLNHVPVMGFVFAFLVALIGAIARSKVAVRVGLIILVVSGLFAVPVYLTGDSAEEIVERLPGISEGIIDQHQSAANLSLVLVGISGVLAMLTLVFSGSLKPKVPGVLFVATMLATLIGGTSMLRTANLGGQIRHTEVRAENSAFPAAAKTRGEPVGEKDEDD